VGTDLVGALLAHVRAVERLTATVAHLKEIIMATQADVDALTTELAAATARIQSEIADLEAAVANGQPVDLGGLKAAVDALDAVVPAPAPEPTPEPNPRPTEA
jgi:hypothetical protein